jgi:hypothetical protein
MKRILLVTATLLWMAGSPSHAAVAFDVALGVDVNEDTRIFLNVTNQTWRPAVPATVLQRCPDPEDDFPVIAFLAYHSHRSPSFILNLRREGYAWSDIFFQVNVSPSVLFVAMDRDPGPPYGKAWGYWKKHYRPGTRVRYRFADRDVVGLVKVQTASRHFGTSPFSIIDAQRGGRRPEVFTAERWKQKNGRPTWARGPGRDGGKGSDGERGEGSSSKGKGASNSKGKGKGSGKGKGQRD